MRKLMKDSGLEVSTYADFNPVQNEFSLGKDGEFHQAYGHRDFYQHIGVKK